MSGVEILPPHRCARARPGVEEINHFCAPNTSLVYFLRTMGVEATKKAAAVHDAAIASAFHDIVGTKLAQPSGSSAAPSSKIARFRGRGRSCKNHRNP